MFHNHQFAHSAEEGLVVGRNVGVAGSYKHHSYFRPSQTQDDVPKKMGALLKSGLYAWDTCAMCLENSVENSRSNVGPADKQPPSKETFSVAKKHHIEIGNVADAETDKKKIHDNKNVSVSNGRGNVDNWQSSSMALAYDNPTTDSVEVLDLLKDDAGIDVPVPKYRSEYYK